MTALNIATDIPSGINTLEKLVAWGSLTLAATNPQLKAVEGTGYQERVAQANPYYIEADNKHRLIGRQSIQLDASYLAGGAKTWTFAQELSSTAIPASFKSN